jgi:hypothetical protein
VGTSEGLSSDPVSSNGFVFCSADFDDLRWRV